MAQQNAVSVTPAEFRQQHNLSEGQFKRMKARVAESLNCPVSVQEGNRWFINPDAIPALEAVLPTSRDQSPEPVATSGSTSALTVRRPAEMAPVIEAELVDEVAELQIILPDHSAATTAAQLEIANTSQVASGNRNLRRQLRRKAMIEQAQREALEDFAIADKAYEATMSQLEQQQLNSIGIGQSASPTAATQSAPATAEPAKKQ